MHAMANPYVLSFSMAAFLYVGIEAAIYVWMPTLFASCRGPAVWLATYSVSVFFLLRAAGRFIGAWMLLRVHWDAVLALFSGRILACFLIAVVGRTRMGRVCAARVRPLHVGDLPDN